MQASLSVCSAPALFKKSTFWRNLQFSLAGYWPRTNTVMAAKFVRQVTNSKINEVENDEPK